MKATGIVRRIDELGRMVIPKEMRRVLKLREGDALEIFTNKQGQIVMSKYSPMSDLSQVAQSIAESLFESVNHQVVVCDRDQIIAAAGPDAEKLMEKNISEALRASLLTRNASLLNEATLPLCEEEEGGKPGYVCQAIAPIIADNEVAGGVILFSKEKGVSFGEVESKALAVAAPFLARQLMI